jgi:hypothetical protein
MSGYEAVGFWIPLFEDSIWKPDPGAPRYVLGNYAKNWLTYVITDYRRSS